ncbi:LytR/AlgR family response regulator transcription factor [Convivina intestini]|uniref:LytR/AlgR family response regulator transcription factor n=1 Tax=Convivina intestini TaxID=1505726 RepID=UPI0020103C90|nr:LytTR family DNA-binding domain-containing protein [Convivina intestini]CAH1852353.1 Transcriptional regulatory protein NatR [Convivina intestini]
MPYNINTLILDDDEIAIQRISHMLTFYNYVKIMKTFTTFNDLWLFLRNNNPDIHLIFLDILLKNESGLDVAKTITSEFPHIKIIFLTSEPSFALDAYETSPIDYITKPIDAVKLQRALLKVRNKSYEKNFVTQKNIKIGIKQKSMIHMVDIRRISLIQKQLRHVKIILSDKSSLTTTEPVNSLYSKLKTYGFVMLSRSVIAPIDQILAFNYDKTKQNYAISLKSDIKVKNISKMRLKELKSQLSEFNWII